MPSAWSDPRLDRYAEIAVRIGVNLQPDQLLVIRAPIEAADFVRRVAQAAYAAGAADVSVLWDDEQLARLRLERAPERALETYAPWRVAAMTEPAEAGAAFLSIAASDPDLLAGVDPQRVARSSRTRMAALSGWYARIGAMRNAWTVVSVPTAAWARRVFPEAGPADAEARLGEAILKAVRADQGDPVGAWRTHLADLAGRAAHLSALALRRLHYRGPGTDLHIDLPAGHLWIGGASDDPRGVSFVPNMPTEEVFTAPARDGVFGTVAATLPLHYQGVPIEGLTLRFEAGRVVAATARRGAETIEQLLAVDEGARHLGEVALVPHGSAVSRLETVFCNTLFDENAASHLALGRAYPSCLAGGTEMAPEALAAHGLNASLEHVDFMVGSAELDIDGETATGRTLPLMRQGRWAFAV